MRVRLILSFTAVALVSVLTFSFVLRQGTIREVRAFMLQGSLEAGEELVADLEAYYRQQQTWDEVGAVMPQFGHGRGGGQGEQGQRLLLTSTNGVVIYATTAAETGTQVSQQVLESAIPLVVDDQTVGFLVPQTGQSTQEQVLLARLNQAALTAAVIGGSLALLLGLVLAYNLLRPVRELTAAAHDLAGGNLAKRVPVRGNDEVATLGQAFNSMAASLQQAEQNRRVLTADIAHELRTPLAIQKGYLEALEDGIYPLDIANIVPLQEQNEILNRLVDDLRTLALAESGQLTLELATTELTELTRRAASQFELLAQRKSIQVKLNLPGQPLKADVDPGRIEQILGNLLSNALRHTPEDGIIQITAARQARQALISVEDSGPGIPPGALEHVFERFYRADRSRSREEGGTGLGLTIAYQLALANGGSLTAGNRPEGGAILTLSLPLKDLTHPDYS